MDDEPGQPDFAKTGHVVDLPVNAFEARDGLLGHLLRAGVSLEGVTDRRDAIALQAKDPIDATRGAQASNDVGDVSLGWRAWVFSPGLRDSDSEQAR